MTRIPSLMLLLLTLRANPLQAEDAAAFYKTAGEKAIAAVQEEHRAVLGQAGWLFLNAELAHLGKGAITKEAAAPAIKEISAYQKLLAAEGCTLILLPVPTKAEIYPDKLVAEAKPDLLAGHQKDLLTDLAAAGVKVIDFAAAMRKKRAEAAEPLLYCERDSHWSPAGIQLAASLVAEAAKEAPGLKEAQPKLTLELSEVTTLSIQGDLLGESHTKSLGPEKVQLHYAGLKEGGKISPQPTSTQAAPIVLLGDSHNIVFSLGNQFHCQGAGLPDQLQHKLGLPVMLVSSPASGGDNARMQLLRQAKRNPTLWQSVKLVVWCFSVREITEGRWREIPVK